MRAAVARQPGGVDQGPDAPPPAAAVARETPAPPGTTAHRAVARETPVVEGPGATKAAAKGFAALGSRSPLSRALTALVLAPIRVYRRLVSPLLGPRCRYYPTCSTYAEQAVRELGPVRGTILAVWRVLRCNPMSSGGLDPLENRRLFRSKRSADPADGPEATD